MKSAKDASLTGHLNLQPPKYDSLQRKILIFLEIILGILIIAAICSISPQSAEPNSAQAQAMEPEEASDRISSSELFDVPDQVATKGECAHQWVPITHTIDHPQVERKIDHDAEYETETSLHTVCNECEKIIDGKAQSHIEKTGHIGFTTQVPISKKILVKEAWIETVVDKNAWTESVIEGYVCSSCKAKSDLSA